jgi:hypothetical protein
MSESAAGFELRGQDHQGSSGQSLEAVEFDARYYFEFEPLTLAQIQERLQSDVRFLDLDQELLDKLYAAGGCIQVCKDLGNSEHWREGNVYVDLPDSLSRRDLVAWALDAHKLFTSGRGARIPEVIKDDAGFVPVRILF